MATKASDVGMNPKYALFAPSTSSMYVKTLNSRPVRFTNTTNDELDYNQKTSPFFSPVSLYSVGHSFLDLSKCATREKMIYNRDRASTILIGDSGGYQIARDIIPIDDDLRSSSADNTRISILRWLEHTADYAMSLDWPAWALGNGAGVNDRFRMKTFADCLSESVYNNNLWVKHRKNEATRILTVVQGRTEAEADLWYDTVKHTPFEGWALAGPVAGDAYLTLRALLMMRDDNNITANKNWIHILGKARLSAAFLLTCINRALQEHVTPEAQVSYDAASAFLCAANGNMITGYNINKSGVRYNIRPIPNTARFVGLDEEFPWNTPIAGKMKFSDLNVKPKGKHFLDTDSYLIIMNHNVAMQLRAIDEMSKIACMPYQDMKLQVPKELIYYKEMINELFVKENWNDYLKDNDKVIRNLMATERSGVSTFNDLFTMPSTQIEDIETIENMEEGKRVDVDQEIVDRLGDHFDMDS